MVDTEMQREQEKETVDNGGRCSCAARTQFRGARHVLFPSAMSFFIEVPSKQSGLFNDHIYISKAT